MERFVSKDPSTPATTAVANPVEERKSGYKHPPEATQFKKLQSGNPKGRPNGRRNFATVIKDAMNEPVPVRSGKTTKNMATLEAMVRVMVNKASQGNGPALSLMLGVLARMGRTTEITDEEREKHGMRLPRPLSREELDLKISPSRERDRQRYLAMAEADEVASGNPAAIPLDIREGDKLITEGAFDNALAAYRLELARCKAQLDADKSDGQAQIDFRRCVSRIGLLANRLLEAGEFQQAKDFAQVALTEAATPFWIMPKTMFGNDSTNTTWIGAIRAHTLMFLGREAEASRFFLSFRSNKREILTSWETSFLRDFVRFRELGYSHSLMNDIERRFAEEGWTTKRENTKIFQKVSVRGEESVFIETHPDDVRAGDLLAEKGSLDEAVVVYLCNLNKCRTELAKNPTSNEGKENLQAASDRLEQMARKFLLAGGFARALECADAALTVAPNRKSRHAIRAQALMFLNRTEEAHKLFLEFRGEMIGRRSWETVILEDFADHRKAYRSRPLMDEIEKLFDAGGLSVRTETGPAIPVAALIASSDIPSAQLLVEQGMLDEAFAVLRRGVEDCKAKIANYANGQCTNRVIDDRTALVQELGTLAAAFIWNRKFQKALDVVDYALSVLPSTFLNIYRAHALMLLDRADEAGPLYVRYRHERVDAERTGQTLILQDFASLREAEVTRPFMDEIEQLFGAGSQSA
jgi:tetratricopeptide (TPR) repeat protein